VATTERITCDPGTFPLQLPSHRLQGNWSFTKAPHPPSSPAGEQALPPALPSPLHVSVTVAGGLSLTPTPTYTTNTNVGPPPSYTYAGTSTTSALDAKTF